MSGWQPSNAVRYRYVWNLLARGGATVAAVCEERRVPYGGQPVATVKRTATGKGNADKQAMVEAAALRWWISTPGYPCCSEDEADALWVAETLRREVSA